jgi:hypothetical protein
LRAARWLVGMELARARAGAREGDARTPSTAESALARAGDAYERVRRSTRGPDGEAARPGAGEALWRAVGRLIATILAPAPGLRRALEDRLLSTIASSD